MGAYDELEICAGFDWDEGNQSRNWDKHRVTDGEAEEIFLNDPLVSGNVPTEPSYASNGYGKSSKILNKSNFNVTAVSDAGLE